MGRGGQRNLIIDVFCNSCHSQLFKYLKEGEGHLIKCYKSNVLEDFTSTPMHCPKCDNEFARDAIVHNRPAYKIIQGTVYVRK